MQISYVDIKFRGLYHSLVILRALLATFICVLTFIHRGIRIRFHFVFLALILFSNVQLAFDISSSIEKFRRALSYTVIVRFGENIGAPSVYGRGRTW